MRRDPLHLHVLLEKTGQTNTGPVDAIELAEGATLLNAVSTTPAIDSVSPSTAVNARLRAEMLLSQRGTDIARTQSMLTPRDRTEFSQHASRLERLEERRLLAAVSEMEPNNTFDTAQPIVPGDVVSASFDPATDLDVFTFDVAAGEVIDVIVDITEPNRQLGYSMYNDNFFAFSSGSGSSFFSPFEFRFENEGTFYVALTGGDSDFDPADGSGVQPGFAGPYTVEIIDNTPPSDDDNDQLSEAAPIVLGETLSSELASPTDVDMYRFDASAGDRISLDADTPFAANSDAALRLFDLAGTELALNTEDVGNLDPQILNGYIEYEFDVAGTYYVGVSVIGNETYDAIDGPGDDGAYGGSGEYSLTLFEGDANDQLSEAGDTFPGSTLEGNLTVAGDVDLYQFSLGASPDSVAVNFWPLSQNEPDLSVRWFDESGNVLAEGNGLSPVVVPIGDGGTFYLGVSGADNANYDPVTGAGDTGTITGFYRGSVYAIATPPQFLGGFYAVDEDLLDAADGPSVIFDFDRDTADGNDTRLAVVFNDGPLPNGRYRLTLPAGTIIGDAGDVPLNEPVSVDFYVLAGDADRNETVDLDDFVILRNHFGQAGVFSQGDFNYDGVIDLADFVILRNNFGGSAGDDEEGGLF